MLPGYKIRKSTKFASGNRNSQDRPTTKDQAKNTPITYPKYTSPDNGGHPPASCRRNRLPYPGPDDDDEHVGDSVGAAGDGGTERAAPGLLLETGELAGRELRFREGRQGRHRLRVIEYGRGRFPWAEYTEAWGARVLAIITNSAVDRGYAKSTFPRAKVWSTQDTLTRSSDKVWNAVLTGTLRSRECGLTFAKLVVKLRVPVALVAMPSLRGSLRWYLHLDELWERYQVTDQRMVHSDHGGVTNSCWASAVLTLPTTPWRDLGLSIPKETYRRWIGSDLNVLEQGPRDPDRLNFTPTEPITHSDGRVVVGQVDGKEDVFHHSGIIGDLYNRTTTRPIWVMALTVYRPELTLRRMTAEEYLAAWDYSYGDDPSDDKTWTIREVWYRLQQPPGRLLRMVLSTVLTEGMSRLGFEVVLPHQQDSFDGTTEEYQTGGLEEEVEARYLRAAKGDGAEIDYDLWKDPGEQEATTRRKDTARKFLHLRWCRFLTRDAVAY